VRACSDVGWSHLIIASVAASGIAAPNPRVSSVSSVAIAHTERRYHIIYVPARSPRPQNVEFERSSVCILSYYVCHVSGTLQIGAVRKWEGHRNRWACIDPHLHTPSPGLTTAQFHNILDRPNRSTINVHNNTVAPALCDRCARHQSAACTSAPLPLAYVRG
jgi:hypothetical protein